MKRSVGVTVASICVIVASVAYCVYKLWTLGPMGREGFAILLAGSIFELLFASLGIATGIALLRLRRWAWACVLVISVVIMVVAIPTLLGAPKLIRATTGVPTVSSGFISHLYFHLIGFGLIPCALGFWWLVFFLRHSVRTQFLPLATSLAAEGNPPLVRSGAVDASAILLLFGSALLLLLAVMIPLMTSTGPSVATVLPIRGILIATGVFYLLIAAWGVVTGIGVLKRRAWGRVLMIVNGALGIAFTVLGGVGTIVAFTIASPNPQLPPSATRGTIVGTIAVLLVPLAISIWWLVLFTRPRITLEFVPTGAAPTGPPTSLPLLSKEPELAAAVPLQFTASVPAPAPLPFAPAQIPMSVRVIAVVEILFAIMAFFGPLSAKITGVNSPLLIFGFLAHGWSVTAFYIVSGALPIIFCAAILLRRRWGLDALIAFLLAEIANYALIFISPARSRFNAELQAQMQHMMAQIKLPAGAKQPPFPFAQTNLLQNLTIGVTAVLLAVLLYFLFTRRRAFRAACAAKADGTQ